MSQRARYIKRKGEGNRKDLEMRQAMEGIRKTWAWMQKLNQEMFEPVTEFNYNTTWVWDPIHGNVHTYYPHCPRGCYGQREDCQFKKKDTQDG